MHQRIYRHMFKPRIRDHPIDDKIGHDESGAFGLDESQRPRVYSRSAGRACYSMPIILR